MFQCKPKAVYAASEQNAPQQVEKFKYIVVVFTSDRRWRLIRGLLKLTQFYVSFIVLWSQNERLQAPQSCQF